MGREEGREGGRGRKWQYVETHSNELRANLSQCTDLRDLPTFVVASYQSYSVRISHLTRHRERERERQRKNQSMQVCHRRVCVCVSV